MGDVLPLYNGENDVSYTLPTGLDFLSNNNNLLKMAIPDMLQRPGNAAYATCQSFQLNQPVGITTKLASWSMNPQANNYGGALSDGGSAHASLAAASLLAGRNAPDLLKNTFPAYHDPTSTMASFLSPRMPGHNLHHQMNEDQGRSSNDSNFGPRSANMHALLPNLSASPPLQESFPSQDFGQNHGWKNSGTELLLLPGSNEALSRNLPHNVASLSSYQSALPFAQWERSERMASAKDEVSLHKDCLQIGRHGQVLSLSLSNSHQQTHSNLHSFDMGISASGSICIIRNSKYLRPAQQLLDEFCNVGKKLKKTYSDRGRLETTTTETGNEILHSNHKTELSRMEREGPAVMEKRGGAPSCPIQERTDPDLPTDSDLPPLMMHPDERSQLQLKKARLVAMVEEVDKAYRQYQEQMQMVITSFESAAGLGGAAPYTVLARQAMSRHFRLLRDAISDQIHVVCKALGEEASSTVPVLCRGETPRLRILDQQLRNQRALQQIGLLQQQPWRPHRGLPERSVSILRAWLFEHFLDPYPKDSEKLMLARQTGLSRNQVSNWFINARVRLWKPMIEDMYREEAKEAEKHAASAGVNSMAGMREGDNKKEQIRDEKQPVDVVSCSLTQQEGDQASAPNSSGSCEYASETRLYGHGEELNNFENVKGDSGEKQKGGMNVGHGGGQIIGAGIDAHIQSKGITGYPENLLYGGRNKAGSGVTLTLGLHQSSNGICISGADYEHARTYYQQQQQSFPSSNILYRGGDQSSSSYNNIRSTQHYGR